MYVDVISERRNIIQLHCFQQDIIDLNGMFKDLGMMVAEQGEELGTRFHDTRLDSVQ